MELVINSYSDILTVSGSINRYKKELIELGGKVVFSFDSSLEDKLTDFVTKINEKATDNVLKEIIIESESDSCSESESIPLKPLIKPKSKVIVKDDSKLENKSQDIEIILYSEKAFAVVGETKAHKDKLKDLGGKWNANLRCGAGWIFPNNKKESVKEWLNNLK